MQREANHWVQYWTAYPGQAKQSQVGDQRFHIPFIICKVGSRMQGPTSFCCGEADGLIKPLHFSAVSTVEVADMLLAAVNGEVVQLCGGDAVQGLKGIGSDPAEAGAIVVNPTFAMLRIVVNAPSVRADQT
jgi:hypothetical protein